MVAEPHMPLTCCTTAPVASGSSPPGHLVFGRWSSLSFDASDFVHPAGCWSSLEMQLLILSRCLTGPLPQTASFFPLFFSVCPCRDVHPSLCSGFLSSILIYIHAVTLVATWEPQSTTAVDAETASEGKLPKSSLFSWTSLHVPHSRKVAHRMGGGQPGNMEALHI